MKRSSLQRKPHPDNPFSSLPPRTRRPRPMSEKRRQQQKETSPQRAAYVANAEHCERCLCRTATDCHEIPAGSSRHRAVKLPNTWLALCRTCHDCVQGIDFLEQFNLKCEAVRRDINRCLGRNEL